MTPDLETDLALAELRLTQLCEDVRAGFRAAERIEAGDGSGIIDWMLLANGDKAMRQIAEIVGDQAASRLLRELDGPDEG